MTQKRHASACLFCVSINPCRACSLSSSQGELEGAKPASNRIKCRAKPCYARRAWSEASIFVPRSGTKIPALLQAVEKSQWLFRQPARHASACLFSLVRVVGVEPTRISSQEPKSCASANSAIPAYPRRIVAHFPPPRKECFAFPLRIWYAVLITQ